MNTIIAHTQYIGDRRKAHGARIRDKPEVVGEAVSARGADPFPDDPGYRVPRAKRKERSRKVVQGAPLVSTSG
jgi:hypothetical protein